MTDEDRIFVSNGIGYRVYFVVKQCTNCGDEVEVPAENLNENAFCSVACVKKYNSD